MHLPLGLMVIFAIVGLLVLLFLLDRLALWMERKGWIFYRSFDPKLTVRGGLTSLESFIHPEINHVREEKEQRHAETDESDPSDH